MSNFLPRVARDAGAVLQRVIPGALFAKRLSRIIVPYFFGRKTWVRAFGFQLILGLCIYLSSQLNVFISHALNHYINVISGQGEHSAQEYQIVQFIADFVHSYDVEWKWSWLGVFLILLAVVVPIQVWGMNWLERRASADLRQFLTSNALRAQANPGVATRMEARSRADDKTLKSDQVMTDNISGLSTLLTHFFRTHLSLVITAYVWTCDLLLLSPFLTKAVYLWAAFVTIGSIWLGKKLLRQKYEYNDREADFRFTLQEARREAESIAYARAEQIVLAQSQARLQSVIGSLLGIYRRNGYVESFTDPTNGLVPILPPLLLSSVVVKSGVGAIFEAGLAVTNLFGGLSMYANEFSGISDLITLVTRWGELNEAQREYAEHPVPEDGISITTGEDIRMESLTLETRGGNSVLINALNLALARGEKLCVLTDDTAVKAELMRLLDRQSTTGSGTAELPAREAMMFLNDKPYIAPTTLRNALTYDCPTCGIDDEQILKALKRAGLTTLAQQGLDTEREWRKLPLDEQRRLNIARALVMNKPYVVLEQSALPEQSGDRFYRLLLRPGTTVVSLLSDAELVKHHDLVLDLSAAGAWKLHKASEFNPVSDGDADGEPAPARNHERILQEKQ